MKKGVFILFAMLISFATSNAKENNTLLNNSYTNYSYNNAVNFEERGIEYFVFTNGEFDFNSNYSNIRINRNYKGLITRIGNSFINYDRFDNVTRIGNVFMNYHRGRLTNVGQLRVRYNLWGNPTFYGSVKNNYFNYNGLQINLNVGTIFNYNDAYFYRNDFRRNYTQIREDANYYYYRANTKANSNNHRNDIVRRRKQVQSNRNNTYRKPTSLNSKRTINNGVRKNSNEKTWPYKATKKRAQPDNKKTNRAVSIEKSKTNKVERSTNKRTASESTRRRSK